MAESAASNGDKPVITVDDDKLKNVCDILHDLRLDSESPRHREILTNVKEYLQAKEQGSTPEKCLINDAIHGPIELSPLLYQIINTPEFHRLKDIHQLGAAHYVYPGANHTRFDHSIGVCHLARVFAESLRDQMKKDYHDKGVSDPIIYQFEPREVLCAQIAGLCHDLGHGPLSHMFEHAVVSVLLPHKKKEEREHELLSVAIFRRIMENPKVLAEFVEEHLTKEHVTLVEEMIRPEELERLGEKHPNFKRLFLYEIVANKNTGIDVDKWDYYARDCHYLGVEHDFQWRRCMLLGRVVMTPDLEWQKKTAGRLRIAFRDKELDNLYGMFRTRAVLHQKAYQHKTIKAVEKMIADAFLCVQKLRIIRIDKDSKSIEEAVEFAYAEQPDLKWYLALNDSIIGTIQCADACTKELCDKLDEAQNLLKRVKERDLYHCVANIRIPKVESPKSVNASIDGELENASAQLDESDETGLNLLVVKKFNDKLSGKDDRKKFIKAVWKSFKSDDIDLSDAEKNLWLEIVKIKLSSEGDGDPVKSVLFYKKSKGSNDGEIPVCHPSEIAKKTSKLVVPQAFVEYELRVYYCKHKANKEDRERLRKITEDTLEEWRKEILKLAQAPKESNGHTAH